MPPLQGEGDRASGGGVLRQTGTTTEGIVGRAAKFDGGD